MTYCFFVFCCSLIWSFKQCMAIQSEWYNFYLNECLCGWMLPYNFHVFLFFFYFRVVGLYPQKLLVPFSVAVLLDPDLEFLLFSGEVQWTNIRHVPGATNFRERTTRRFFRNSDIWCLPSSWSTTICKDLFRLSCILLQIFLSPLQHRDILNLISGVIIITYMCVVQTEVFWYC